MQLKMLIWKDFRQQARFLVASGFLLLVPYLITAIVFAVVQSGEQPHVRWIDFLRGASLASLMISIVLFGFFPANAIAGERADRSAEFFAYLPIRRADAVLSKAAVALALSTAVLGTCVGLAYLSMAVGRNEPGPSGKEGYLFFATLVAMFGIAWFVSSFASSATYAAAAGISVPICFAVTFGLLLENLGIPGSRVGNIYAVSCFVLGLGSFAGGTLYYLRRVEP